MKKLLILWLVTFSSVLFAQKSTTSSVKELERECNSNIVNSCLILGIKYENGDGLSQDKLKASELYQKACDGNIYSGCFYLAMMY